MTEVNTEILSNGMGLCYFPAWNKKYYEMWQKVGDIPKPKFPIEIWFWVKQKKKYSHPKCFAITISRNGEIDMGPKFYKTIHPEEYKLAMEETNRIMLILNDYGLLRELREDKPC